MCPEPRCAMSHAYRCVNSVSERMLSRSMFMTRASGCATKSPYRPYPALLISTSTARSCASVRPLSAVAASGVERSIAKTTICTPSFRRSRSASSSMGSRRRATRIRLARCSASNVANSTPNPLDAPVTSAHFPSTPTRWLTIAPLLSLFDFPQCHGHRRHPVNAILRSFVAGGQGLAPVAEDASATNPLAQPLPRIALVHQRLGDHVPLAVEEPGAELIGVWLMADDLDAASAEVSQPPVGGVHDEVPAGHPLVDVARHDRDRRCAVTRDRLAFRDPPADEDVEPLEPRRGSPFCEAPSAHPGRTRGVAFHNCLRLGMTHGSVNRGLSKEANSD